ncbi:tRNA methyltransferase complex GCD14 subunit domain-containing protein [Ditylenchus destructor]|uniref:tRNA (adenine(58)-N(1))-methyltransferase catalytic subunit TRMT61A n=1 Tax=Ditylenchus destructor TaxID=166010 RepID=A0AAD4NK61_9BILA|nr:tRNA methyltransferase complex GCD14 subunit domain-containing protein [Ditylenchus destructor]
MDTNNMCLESSFIKNNDIIEEGDTVVVYLDHTILHVIIVQRGKTLNMKYGALRHEFLIGKRYGTQISATAGYIFPLRPNPNLWTKTLSRQTQILYTPDIATILFLLDAKPGSIICESGTGSGSLSHAIATTIAPHGHLYTHDIEEARLRIVESDLKEHGLAICTTAIQQDVCEDGFFVENACDGVFLDLPAPWLAIPHAVRALSRVRGGRIVSFSPCIEQVQKFCENLELYGFIQIETIEVVPRKLKVCGVVSETLAERDLSHPDADGDANGTEKSQGKAKKRKAMCLAANSNEQELECMPYPANQPTHTGYLTSATLLSSPID